MVRTYAVQQFKGATSRILRDEFPILRARIPTLWTRSYYAESYIRSGDKKIHRGTAKQMKALKVKLYNSDNSGFLCDMINIAGIIYNTALTLVQDHYEKHGVLIKKNEHWRMVESQAVQDVTDRIYQSYKLFFNNRKKGLKASPPRRVKVKKYKSVTCKQSGYKFLPGGQVYRYWASYDGFLEAADIHTMTIKRNIQCECFLYLTVDATITRSGTRDGRTAVGMDFGLKTFLTLSDGIRIESPEFLKKGMQGAEPKKGREQKQGKGGDDPSTGGMNISLHPGGTGFSNWPMNYVPSIASSHLRI